LIQLLADRARRLATGESLVVPAKEMELEPAPRLVDVTYGVRRMPDDGGRAQLSVERVGVSARWKATVSVEANGVVLVVRQEQQLGVVDYRR